MFTLINKELFSMRESNTRTPYGVCYQTDVLTSPAVVLGPASKFISSTRQLLRIYSKEADYNNVNQLISLKPTPAGNNSVSLKADASNRYDANVMAVAFPFNGVVKPIEFSKQYRIHRGMIVSSTSNTVELGDKKFRNILYFLIEPHYNLFAEDHAYHTPEIRIPFESYEDCPCDETTTERKSYVHRMILVITKDSAHVEWDEEYIPRIPRAVTAEFRKEKLFTLYVPEEKHKSSENLSETNEHPQTYAPPQEKVPTTNTYAPDSNTGSVNPIQKPQSDWKPAFKHRDNTGGGFNKDRYHDDEPRTKRTGNRGKKSRKGR